MNLYSGPIRKEQKLLKFKKNKKNKKKKQKIGHRTIFTYHANNKLSTKLELLQERYKKTKQNTVNSYQIYRNYQCTKYCELLKECNWTTDIFEYNQNKPLSYLESLFYYHNSVVEKNYVFEKRKFKQDMTRRFEEKPQKDEFYLWNTESYLWKILFNNE